MFKKSRSFNHYTVSFAKVRSFLISEDTPFAAKEAYKSTRTHLMYTCVGEGCKKIVFTSSFEHEGKTLTCINLGISLAQAGKRVLIIDADLRRPMLNNVLELRESQGLSEQLAGIADTGDSSPGQVFACKTKYENLAVLPAGHTPPNPAELLSSRQMHSMLEVLEQYFDYILIDTPPIGEVTDAAVLIPEVHGHILVVRAGSTRLDELRMSVEKMEQLGANILGFILNDYDAKKGLRGYSHGKYNKGYGYYGYGYSKMTRAEEEYNDNRREVFGGGKEARSTKAAKDKTTGD